MLQKNYLINSNVNNLENLNKFTVLLIIKF